MAQTTMNIRIDERLKSQFSDFCEAVGMSMSTAVCMFAKNTIKNQTLPFEVTTRKTLRMHDPFWNDENQRILKASIAELESTGGTVHDLEEL